MSRAPLADIDAYFTRHRPRFLEELDQFLRIPSVSADPERRDDVARAANWLADALRAAGLTAEVHSGEGHPIVLAEWRRAGAGARTVLIYGHYDVQPPGPIDLWQTPPFHPTVRDGRVYARGATDDKSQLLLHVKALEAWLAVRGELPVNVFVLAEGEEETGGSHLRTFLARHTERLRASAVVISDSAMFAPGMPAIVTSLRGTVGLEVEVFGPATELHSGDYGGTVVNPATALARLLASAHDAGGHIVIPGFTDRCRPWPPREVEAWRQLPFSDDAFRREARVLALAGEAGYSTLERRWMRPTFEVTGMIGGYTDAGMKSIVPASALAKVSCRLVPDQDPEEIVSLVGQWVRAGLPPGVRVDVRTLFGVPPWRSAVTEWLHDAADRATQAVFGCASARVGGGGSIPIVTDIDRLTGAPVLLLGFGMPGENAHGPNEHFDLGNFDRGMRVAAALWDQIGAQN